jgi:hypothetical protein
MVWGRIAALLLLALALAGCGGSPGQSSGDVAAGSVVELKSLKTLTTAFDGDTGKARLLLLLSPT